MPPPAPESRYGTAVLHGGPCDGREIPIITPPPPGATHPVAREFAVIQGEFMHVYHLPLTERQEEGPPSPPVHHYQFARTVPRSGN